MDCRSGILKRRVVSDELIPFCKRVVKSVLLLKFHNEVIVFLVKSYPFQQPYFF